MGTEQDKWLRGIGVDVESVLQSAAEADESEPLAPDSSDADPDTSGSDSEFTSTSTNDAPQDSDTDDSQAFELSEKGEIDTSSQTAELQNGGSFFDFAADDLDVEQTAPEILTGGPGTQTLTMAEPIGVLELISFAPSGSSGREFQVIIVASAKDALLFGAVASGADVGTVKVSQSSGNTTLSNVIITSFSRSGAGASNTLTLESRPPRKQPSRPARSTITMANPIGVLRLISATSDDSRRQRFQVKVASSAKDALLFGAVASGQSVGTVKIAQTSGTTTLLDVQITSFQALVPDPEILMTLDASRSAEFDPDE